MNNKYGTRSISFTQPILEELETQADKSTDGNLSELVRVLLRSSLDRMKNGKLVVKKTQTKALEIN